MRRVGAMLSRFGLGALVALTGVASVAAEDVCDTRRAARAAVYVPLYSHIYFGDAMKPFNLAATVSIRNVDPKIAIEITRADYHDSNGKLLRSFLSNSVQIAPLASYSFKVNESDVAGGSGASVLLSWKAGDKALAPIVESVMIGTAFGQGISFTSRARILEAE